jgi:transposase
MPWEGVTVSEQRQRFLEDYQLKYCTIVELADRFSNSPKTARKWINRFEQYGQAGYQELSRRPHSCPWQTDAAIAEELVSLRTTHPRWGPGKLLDLMARRDPERHLPVASTAAEILRRAGPVKPRRRYRWAHPGCPKSQAQAPNDIWGADYKGQFRLKHGSYCFPPRVSDLASRYVLGVDAHSAISLGRTIAHFRQLFGMYGLPNRIRTDNGVHDLYFCFYQIGRYDLKENRIRDIVSRVVVSRRQVDLASRVLPMSSEQGVTDVSGMYRRSAYHL